MNILFLTLLDFESINEKNIYTDLLREFVKHEHSVYIISPVEKRKGEYTHIVREKNSVILKLKIGNIQKTNLLEKGVSTLNIESQFIAGIKKFFKREKFDLVLYSTPPITFCRAVKYVKKRDGAKTYLLLKDIFPQNAVDIGMLRKTGVKGLLYRYFRAKERKLYKVSDTIGCMSKANMRYVLKYNPEIDSSKVEICPNSIEVIDMSIGEEERKDVRRRYHIPEDRVVFVYGGNLGKPQDINFMLKCLHSQRRNKNLFFLIIGSGTEYGRIEHYIQRYRPENIVLYQWIPKEDYDKLVAACNVGLIFLDHRFTIPNFPSRLLSYMSAKLPVLAVTDRATDLGEIVVNSGFGWWCESRDVDDFRRIVKDVFRYIQICNNEKGERGFRYLCEKYSVKDSYKLIGQKIWEKEF